MPIGDLLAQITGEPSPTEPTPPLPPKRKADGDLRKPADKLQKTEQATGNSSRPVSHPPTVNSKMANIKLGSTRPSVPSPSTTFKNGQPTPPPSTDTTTSKPAKKGSFAEIMARGKAAQATLGQVGKIQHKKIEKPPTKREREEMQAQKAQNLRTNLGPNGKLRSAGQSAIANGRSGERAPIKKQAASEPVKKVKKAAVATTGYTGTARPKPGSTPSKPSASSSSRYDSPARHKDDRRAPASKKYRYASEEEEEEEDELDYGSDVSSDMEADAFEVDEEEEAAARIARREDAEALAEENRLKREKEEKKRRLAAMAAKNRR